MIKSLPQKQSHTWIEVDMQAIRSNVIALKTLAKEKNKDFLMMVKANAYGHGLNEVAVLAEELGARFLGVSYFEEAIQLRDKSIKAPILLFTQPSVDYIQYFKQYSITPVVSSFLFLSEVAKWCADYGEELAVHIKIDTGLNRFGFRYDEVEDLLSVLSKNPSIKVEGILTHYSSADVDLSETKKQLNEFLEVVEKFKLSGFKLQFIHASNSAATGWLDESQTNLVRLGLAAYGLLPSVTKEFPISLKKSLTWKTVLIEIRDISEGERVGYGKSWIANKDTRIGIIAVGYSDGFRRAPSNYGHVLCHGVKVPIIGKVMMSHSIIDLKKIKDKASVGDEVVVVGKQENEETSLEEIANTLGTINEEVVTSISPSIVRMYN